MDSHEHIQKATSDHEAPLVQDGHSSHDCLNTMKEIAKLIEDVSSKFILIEPSSEFVHYAIRRLVRLSIY